MATTVSAFTSLQSSICRTNFHGISTHSSSSSSSLSFPTRSHGGFVKSLKKSKYQIRAVEEETLAPEEATIVEVEAEAPSSDQSVSVPVSPSDLLTMFFQAEGTLSEAAIPSVAKALEQIEGVANLKVQVVEGIASVELAKQTTVQATGVASSLVEIIQGSGFKLQTLNLSFEDEEDSIG